MFQDFHAMLLKELDVERVESGVLRVIFDVLLGDAFDCPN